MTTDPTSGETVNLSSAMAYAETMAKAAGDSRASVEQSVAHLATGEVSGDVLGHLAAAGQALSNAAAAFDAAHAELARQQAVKDAYQAVPDAGDKEFVTGNVGRPMTDAERRALTAVAASLGAELAADDEVEEAAPRRRPRPASADLRRGGRYGQHVLPERADDMEIEDLVKVIFAPQPMFPGMSCREPCDPVLVQQLLDYAPQTDRTGVDDWGRPLRADERAEIWGTPMEGDPLDVRIAWLRRADEICRAWGQPLAGPGGLAPDMTLPTRKD